MKPFVRSNIGPKRELICKTNSSGESKSYTLTNLDALVSCIDNFSDYEKHKQNALLLRKTLLERHCTWDYARKGICWNS